MNLIFVTDGMIVYAEDSKNQQQQRNQKKNNLKPLELIGDY